MKRYLKPGSIALIALGSWILIDAVYYQDHISKAFMMFTLLLIVGVLGIRKAGKV